MYSHQEGNCKGHKWPDGRGWWARRLTNCVSSAERAEWLRTWILPVSQAHGSRLPTGQNKWRHLPFTFCFGQRMVAAVDCSPSWYIRLSGWRASRRGSDWWPLTESLRLAYIEEGKWLATTYWVFPAGVHWGGIVTVDHFNRTLC